MYKQTKLHLQRYDWKVLLNRGTSSPGTTTSFLAIHENRRTPGTDMNQLNESKRGKVMEEFCEHGNRGNPGNTLPSNTAGPAETSRRF